MRLRLHLAEWSLTPICLESDPNCLESDPQSHVTNGHTGGIVTFGHPPLSVRKRASSAAPPVSWMAPLPFSGSPRN